MLGSTLITSDVPAVIHNVRNLGPLAGAVLSNPVIVIDTIGDEDVELLNPPVVADGDAFLCSIKVATAVPLVPVPRAVTTKSIIANPLSAVAVDDGVILAVAIVVSAEVPAAPYLMTYDLAAVPAAVFECQRYHLRAVPT